MDFASGRNRMDETTPSEKILKAPQAFLRYHPEHTWSHLQSADLASVGSTDFAIDFLGTPATILLPREWSRSPQQAEVAWTLVSAKGRRLRQVTPVAGKVD